jgi:hypothetical protein
MVNIWAIINLLWGMPVLVLRLNTAELLGVTAYALAFALLESLTALLFLLLLGLLLPPGVLSRRFASRGAALLLLGSAWLMGYKYRGSIFPAWNAAWISLWAISFLVVSSLVLLGLHKSDLAEPAMESALDRIAVLSTLYLILDLLGVVTVIVRNVA